MTPAWPTMTNVWLPGWLTLTFIACSACHCLPILTPTLMPFWATWRRSFRLFSHYRPRTYISITCLLVSIVKRPIRDVGITCITHDCVAWPACMTPYYDFMTIPSFPCNKHHHPAWRPSVTAMASYNVFCLAVKHYNCASWPAMAVCLQHHLVPPCSLFCGLPVCAKACVTYCLPVPCVY